MGGCDADRSQRDGMGLVIDMANWLRGILHRIRVVVG